MRSTRVKELSTVFLAGAVGIAVILGAATLASPNRVSASSTQRINAVAHTDHRKVRPADGVDPDVDAEGQAVRENPSGDEEEREATVAHPGAATGSCGVERWSVKTGTDADAGKITVGSTTSTHDRPT